jgi:type II secretory pathway pseudopilin PulG
MKKAFTLIELAIVVVILWIGLIGVFSTLKNSYRFLQEIKEKTMAINFARGGVEWVFSIRNTNWQRWAGKKDQCWLKVNPLVDEENAGCENDEWFDSWSYILNITGTQQYFILQKQNTPFNPTWPLAWDDWKYLLCLDPNTNLIQACTDYTNRPANYFDPTLFFRQVRWWYLMDKNTNTLIDCDNWEDDWGKCWDWRFEEKNFCVDVFYFDGTKKKVTFCTVMTNFME